MYFYPPPLPWPQYVAQVLPYMKAKCHPGLTRIQDPSSITHPLFSCSPVLLGGSEDYIAPDDAEGPPFHPLIRYIADELFNWFYTKLDTILTYPSLKSNRPTNRNSMKETQQEPEIHHYLATPDKNDNIECIWNMFLVFEYLHFSCKVQKEREEKWCQIELGLRAKTIREPNTLFYRGLLV